MHFERKSGIGEFDGFCSILLAFALVTLAISLHTFYMFPQTGTLYEILGFSGCHSFSFAVPDHFITTGSGIFSLEIRKVVDMFNILLLFYVFAFMQLYYPQFTGTAFPL